MLATNPPNYDEFVSKNKDMSKFLCPRFAYIKS